MQTCIALKNYIGNCVNPPYEIEQLIEITENAEEIKKQVFLNMCYVSEDFEKMINSKCTTFHYYRGICFFTHSGIEYFFE